MKFKYILVPVLIIFSAYAQINTEKFRSMIDSIGFSGYTTFDFYLRTGNVDLREIGLSGRLDYRSTSSVVFFIFDGDYGWQNKKQYSNEALVHLRYLYDWKPVIKPEVFLQTDYNKARLLVARLLGGAGVRFNLFHGVNASFWMGTSLFQEFESYDLPSDVSHSKHLAVMRWSNYFSFRYFKTGLIELSGVLYYQPQIDAFKDYRMLNENYIRLELAKWFSLTISINIRFDSLPPDGIDNLDTRTKIGFGFKF
jgi:hypothetical protein